MRDDGGSAQCAGRGGDMTGSEGLRVWGRHLEDELSAVEAVIAYAVNDGSVRQSTEWVRGRHAPLNVFPTRGAFDAFIDVAWDPQRVFFVRQVPALRFDTVHGGVLVTDAWGDTDYRTLRAKAGVSALRVGAPLLQVARRVEELRGLRPAGQMPAIIVQPTGWQEIEVLRPRVHLRAWSSMAMSTVDAQGNDQAVCEWAVEPHRIARTGALAVVRACESGNDARAIAQGRAEMVAARRRAATRGGVDVLGGIADLERFANQW